MEHLRNPHEPFDIENFVNFLTMQCYFDVFRYTCMNEAFWLFSFRYFTISFVIPWQLKQVEEPRWFRWVIFLGFLLGCLANVAIPVAFTWVTFKINGSLKKSEAEASTI